MLKAVLVLGFKKMRNWDPMNLRKKCGPYKTIMPELKPENVVLYAVLNGYILVGVFTGFGERWRYGPTF